MRHRAAPCVVYFVPMRNLSAWIDTRDRVLVMGILNVTPDSFYNDSRFVNPSQAVERALQMQADGADIIDVGGESSRPGSDPVSTQTEIDRVLPVVAGIHSRSDVYISIDTTKADVAHEALTAGATIVNDISAFRFDREMAAVVAQHDAYAALMHMKGTPKTMQDAPEYDDVVAEVGSFLRERKRVAEAAGVRRDRLFLDPGIGFGKRLSDNLELIVRLGEIAALGSPVVIGVSRKSFLGHLLTVEADQRLEGTIAANAIAVANGADIIRVHDVREGRRTADVAFRLRRSDR